MAVGALGPGVSAGQFQWVAVHGYLLPNVRRLVTARAFLGRRRVVRPDVTSFAVGKLAVQIARYVTVQANTHRADDAMADRVKAVPDSAVAVAAQHIRDLAVGDLIMGCAQPVLWKLVWQILVAGDAHVGFAGGWIADHILVGNFGLGRRPVAIVTGDAAYFAVGHLGRLKLDLQSGQVVLSRTRLDERLQVQVTVGAATRRDEGRLRFRDRLHLGRLGLGQRLQQ